MRYAFCNSLRERTLRPGPFGAHPKRRPARLPGRTGGRDHLRRPALLPPPDARPLTEGGLPPSVARPPLRRSGMGSPGLALSLDTGPRGAFPGAVELAAVVRTADHDLFPADAAEEPARRLRPCTRPRDARRKRSERLACGRSEGVCPPDWAATDLRGPRRRIEGPVFPCGPKRLTPHSPAVIPRCPVASPFPPPFPPS